MGVTGWRIKTPPEVLAGIRDHTRVEIAYGGSMIWTSLSRNDPLEDFANSFAMYFLDPASLQQMSPDRYTWMAATFGR